MPTRQDRHLPPNPLLFHNVLEAKRREATQARRRTIAAIDLAARPQVPPPPPIPTPIEARAGREVRRPMPSFTGEYPGPSPVPRPALPPAISGQGVQPGIAEGVTPVLRGAGQIVRGTGETLQRFLKRVLGLKPGPLPPPTSIPQAIGRGLPALIGILEREFTVEELAAEPFYQQALMAIPAGAFVGPEFRAAGALAREAIPQAQLAAKALGRELVTTPAVREAALKAAMPLRMAEEGPPIVGRGAVAYGPDPSRPYQVRHRLVELDDLIPSHTDAMAPNPAYDKTLQPRMRESRLTARVQVDTIAKKLEPEALILDTSTLDRGSPIIGADMMVESGNGRVLALRKAHQLYPERWAAYQKTLKEALPQLGLSPEQAAKMRSPVLVRERLTNVDRVRFAQEANQPGVMAMSPLENAIQDASRLHLENLVVPEETLSLDASLRMAGNRPFITDFLATLPATERAMLVDASGTLNLLGTQRLKAAMFARTYPGDVGKRLTQIFFESREPLIRNVEDGMMASLAKMAQAEDLIRAGARDPSLSIAEDLAASLDMLARVKQQKSTVAKYLAQIAMFQRELTPFQERLLKHFEAIARSPKAIRQLLGDYADRVIASPPPQQARLIAGPELTKEGLFDVTVKAQLGPLFAEVPTAPSAPATQERLVAEAPGIPQAKVRPPVPVAPAPAAAGPRAEVPPSFKPQQVSEDLMLDKLQPKYKMLPQGDVVRIYRGLRGQAAANLRGGDWVTPNYETALRVAGGDAQKVIQADVAASDLYAANATIGEYIFAPKSWRTGPPALSVPKAPPRAKVPPADFVLLKEAPRNVPYTEVPVKIPKVEALADFQVDLRELLARKGESPVDASFTRQEIATVRQNIARVKQAPGDTVVVRRYKVAAAEVPPAAKPPSPIAGKRPTPANVLMDALVEGEPGALEALHKAGYMGTEEELLGARSRIREAASEAARAAEPPSPAAAKAAPAPPAAPPPVAAVPPVEPPKPPITVPPGPPPGEPFAANIRLSKFPEELRFTIKDWADAHPDLVQEARRGMRSDAQVLEDARTLVNEIGGDFAKLQKRWKPGEAWNAEEITAIRGTLGDATRKVMERQAAIKAGADTAENLLALQQALLEHAQTQTIVHGITAEAGRSLRAFRQTITEALASGNTLKMQKILDKIGKRADLEEVARKLGQLDMDNPAQVAAFIRSMVKPKAMDYVVEWYINSLLSGPTTHMVNAISNAVMVMTLPARTTLAAGIDIGLAALQRRPRERFFAEMPAQVIGAFQGVPEGARAALHTMRYGMKPLMPSKYELPRIKAFTSLPGKAVNLPSNSLEAMDAFFYHINFRAAFNAEAVRLARRQPEAGVSFAERVVAIKQNPPERLIARADQIAEEMLFRAEPGSFTQAIMGLRDKTLLGIPVGRLFIPFVRTPANILIQGFQHSPVGVLNPKLWRSLAAKNPEAADLLAKSVLGTAVAVALTTYFAEGRITGPAPTNPAERDRFYRLGKLPWAIRVGDTWVQYRRVEPFNMSLTLIAGVIEAVEKGNDKDALSKAGAAISTLGRNFFDQTYMTGLADLMDALEDPDRWGSRLARRFGLSFLPYSRAQAQLAASISPTYKAPETFLEQAKSQIPGLATGVSPKLTVFGEEIKRTSPAWWPIAYSPAKEDFLNSELERLQINIGFAGKTIAGRKLSAFEQQQYQEVSGKVAKGALLLLVVRTGYARLPDESKEKVIRRVTDRAREQSRAFLSGEATLEQVERDLTNYIRTTLLPPMPTMRRLRVRRRGIRERGRRRITIQ